MRVIIVGGGIAGLSAARALRVSGLDDYTVFEQAPELLEVGAGVQITNNAARVIDYLGLTEALSEGAVRSEGSVYRDLVTNELILSTPAGDSAEERYGFPYYQVHRARLLDVLRSSVPSERLRLGTRCVAAGQDGESAWVDLDTGERVRGDAVIGADGIHSVIRHGFAEPGAPEFSGIIGCRALIPYERVARLGLDHSQHSWWGRDRSLVAYWVDAGRHLNFLAMLPSAHAEPESWKAQADPATLREAFAGSCETVTAMVDMIDECFVTGVFDRPPLDHIVDGRIGLMGDAAHPFWPFLANGAAQSLEDAVVLARCLLRGKEDVAAALRDYQARRLPRATYVQVRSRDMEHLCHMSDPERVRTRNATFRAKMSEDPTGGWMRDWLWGYDAVAAADADAVEEHGVPAPEMAQL